MLADGVSDACGARMVEAGESFVSSSLQGEQPGVVAIEFDQVFVAAAFDDSAIFDDDNLAGHSYG